MTTEPDREQIDTFVRVLFKHVTAGNWVSLRTFFENKKVSPFQITTVKFNGRFEPLIEAACRDAKVAANNPKKLVFCPPVATFSNGDHARGEDLAEGPALSVECDQHPLAARTRLEQLIGAGTIVDQSGGAWSNPETGELEPKLHLFWRLARPTATPGEHASLREARALATELVGGDTSNIAVVHPIRWPGSWHRKGEPKLCRTIACHPEVEIDLDPTLAILRAAAGENGSKPKRGRTDDEILALLELSRTEGQWHNAIRDAIASMIGRNWSDSAIKLICGPYCTGEYQDVDLLPLIAGARKKWNKLDEEPAAPAFSEEALALSFARRHATELRNVAQWGKWFCWDGLRWIEDHTRKVFDLSRQVCRDAASQANTGRKELTKAKTRAAVVSLASDDRRLAATVEQWDADLWALNTPGGIIDLRSGRLRPATPEDFMTLMTAVAPGGDCPRWHEFLAVVTAGDEGLPRFLQDACGYALTGSTREEILLFLHGGGQNGKSVFIKTIAGVLGDYHMAATMEMFVDSPYERHPTDMARLRGARLVTAAETEQGRYWAESKIKMLTGGDRIAARFMRQDFFEYTPQFTLMIFGNHRPSLKSVDEAIRRRIRLIPFMVKIAEDKRDRELATKLKAEWPGILAWMVEGCLRWQRHGLVMPEMVKAATDEYLASEDAISRWLDDCCSRDRREATLLAALYSSWSGWAERVGERVGSAKQLAQELASRGFERRRTESGYELIGLKIKVDVTSAEGSKNPDDIFGRTK